MCFFVNEKEFLNTLKCLCGVKVLLELLDYDNYYPIEVKELLIKQITEIMENYYNEEDNENEILKILDNEEINEQIRTKDITLFKYSHSEYSFGVNDEISIIPFLMEIDANFQFLLSWLQD